MRRPQGAAIDRVRHGPLCLLTDGMAELRRTPFLHWVGL